MVNINLNQLRTFLTVVESESLTVAAKKLNISVQAVSQSLSKLEDALNMSLLTTTSQRVTFTPSGKALYTKGKALLHQHDKLMLWANSENETPSIELDVVVQSTDFYESSLAPFLGGFYQQYPDIKLNIMLQEELISSSRLTADIYWGLGEYLGQNFSLLKYKPLMKSDYGVYASAEYLQRYGTPNDPSDLHHHLLIGNSGHSPPNSLFLKQPNQVSSNMNSVRMNTSIVVPRGHLQLGLQGLGLFNLNSINELLPQSIERGDIVPVLEKFWYRNLKLVVYYHSTDITQPAIRKFIDYFSEFKAHWQLST